MSKPHSKPQDPGPTAPGARLRSGVVAQRLEEVEALARDGALAPLCRALNDREEKVRIAAARALGSLGAPAISTLDSLLDCGNLLQRKTAAWALGYCGPDALRPVEEALRATNAEVRRAAVKGLRRLELPECTPLLCRMLGDRKQKVRMAAVRALGEIGDERAVGPLCAVLRSCFVGRSARWQLGVGLVIATAVGLLLAFILSGVLAGTGYALLGSFGGISNLIISYYCGRRQSGELSRAVTKALVQIGERRPTPELRTVLPDLRVMAKDRLQHDPRTREASRAAVQRIEVLTESLKDLPLPGSPGADEASLPRVGVAPAPAERSLPRVR